MIKEIKIKAVYNDGLFGNSTYQNLAKLINTLIDKTNEQSKAINRLTIENQQLKEKLAKSE
jgi:cell shape-determining protein MreC